MKPPIFTLYFLMFVLTSGSFAQNDTLQSVLEFNAPSENPWGIAFDGNNLWISDNNSGSIYKMSTTGELLGSVTVSNAKITGIAFINDTLWSVNTMIMGDTTIDSSAFSLFSLYQINTSTGAKYDSISIMGSATNIMEGDLWGICSYNSRIYVSYNGGYGSCLYEIDPISHSYSTVCCTHLCGMSTN